MSSSEEIVALIAAKGEEIRLLKAAKPATLKQDLEPLIAQLLNLKLQYKETTGEDFGGAKEEKPKATASAPAADQGPSKAQLAKEKKKAETKAKKAEAKKDTEETPKPSPILADGEDPLSHLYGDLPIIRSAYMSEKVYRNINDLSEDQAGQFAWLRGRLSNSRSVGKGIFIIIRQQLSTIQSVMFQGDNISKQMIKYAQSISLESVIDILAEITVPKVPIQSVTKKELELQIKEIHIVSRAQPLPFGVEDAGRNEAEALNNALPLVDPDRMLNYRWVDTRTPANQAIFRIQSGVCQLFREFLISKHFIEIHTPKLNAGASEGGSSVFTLKYFDQPACLAQSPQLYKQMAAACGGKHVIVLIIYDLCVQVNVV